MSIIRHSGIFYHLKIDLLKNHPRYCIHRANPCAIGNRVSVFFKGDDSGEVTNLRRSDI